jgi:glycosyltransferase involved in cell wall biosynthesis
MAFGKPVVATRAGGPLEIVDDGKSGFLVAPSSANELAEALLKLLHDQKLRTTMGMVSRELYETKFTARRMAREIAAVYQQAMK